MYNQEVEYNGSAWAYSPLKYWPNEENDKVSFFTYAPYPDGENGVNSTYIKNSDAGLPQIEFDLQDDAASMVDFVAGQNIDLKRQQDRVIFNMKHQLTRVTFSASTVVDNVNYGANADGDGESYVVVKSMNIVESPEFYTKGIYTHNNTTTNNDKTDHNQDGTWTVSEPAKGYSLESVMASSDELDLGGYTESGVAIPIAQDDYTSLFADKQYLFLLPPNGSKGLSEESVKVEIVYDIVTIDSEVDGGHTVTESTYTVALPAGTLAQGKAYNYQLKFDVTEVLVDGNIVDWDDDNENVSGGTVDPFESTVAPDYDIEVDGSGLGNLTTDNEGDNFEDIVSGADAAKITSWESTNPAVATVDNDGTVTIGDTAGTTTINGYIGDELVVSYEITVGEGASQPVDPSEPEDLTTTNPSEDLGDLFIGETAETNVTATPAATITWTSSNNNIATVDANGVVTAVAGGKATITGTTENGATIEFTVEVWSKLLSYTATPDELEVDVDESATVKFNAVFEPYVDAAYTEGIKNASVDSSDANVTISGSWASDKKSYSATITGDSACDDKAQNYIAIKAQGKMSNNECTYEYCYITVVGDDPKFNYDGIFEGDYVYSDGTTGPAQSGAIGYIYHVDKENGYALAISPSVGNVSNWGPNESTFFGATNTECGYYNGAKLYGGTAIGDIASCQVINNAWKMGEVAALKDQSDESKGHWYCPANAELAEMRTTNTEWSKIMSYTGTTGYNVMWSSTEQSASQAYLTFNDYQSGNYSAYGKTSVYSGWSKRAVYRIIKF